nr:serine/threonine-protein phosphatase [Lachnospiraceae bacterium]
ISMVGFVLFGYTLMKRYKEFTIKDNNYVLSLLDKEFLKSIYETTLTNYNERPAEYENQPLSEDYAYYLLDRLEFTDEFWKSRDIVVSYREQEELSNFALGFLDEEKQRFIYVLDGDKDEYAYIPGQYISHSDGDLTTIKTIHHIMNSNRLMIPVYGHAHGWALTNFIPFTIPGCEIQGVAMVDVPINEVIHRMIFFALLAIPFFVIVATINATLNAEFLGNRLVKPLLKLSTTAKEYIARDKTADDLDTHIFKDEAIHTGDEIEILSNSLSDMEEDLNSTIKRVRVMAAEKERFNNDLKLATNIQSSQLPRKFPAFPDREDFDIYAYMNTALEVGGDFYDFFMPDENHIALVIADVSDKGIPAALFMMIAKALLKNELMKGESPAQALSSLNEQLMENNESHQFVTIWTALIDLRTGKGVACNGGHERPVLKRAGGEYELVVYNHCMAVACFKGIPYKDHEFELHPGDTIFVYTDGVVECENSEHGAFESERMLNALNREKDAAPEKLIANVMEDINAFKGDAAQFDDITMLSFVYKGQRS